MEIVPQYLFWLAAYWIIFFRKFLKDPFLLCTSELASTYFPQWIWTGRQLRSGKFPFTDDIYYRYPACIPFLSTFYLPKLISAWVGTVLALNKAFKVFAVTILAHYLIGSVIAYWTFRQWAPMAPSLFGALTLTYGAYNIKPNTPAFTFTACWIPGMFIKGWFGALSCGMAILGGYYPILVYVLPIALIINFGVVVSGIAIGLPQLIPFLWYWIKSIRVGKKEDPKFGRVPIWKLIDFIIPINSTTPTNGVHYPEVEMYISALPLFFIWHLSFWWISLFYALLTACGAIPSIQRIPARALYLGTLSITALAVQGCQQCSLLNSLIIFQAFLLLRNSSIYPSFPFIQWWNRPDKLYSKFQDDDTWPNFSGYLTQRHTNGYAGAFSLKGGQWSTPLK